MALLKGKLNIPLVVIGNGKKEKEEAKSFMAANGISNLLILLNELPQANESDYTTAKDFPGYLPAGAGISLPIYF